MRTRLTSYYIPLLFFLLVQCANVSADTETQRLDAGLFIVSETLTPPTGSAHWQALQMPYQQRGVPFHDRPKVIWLKFRLDDNYPSGAVYLSRYQTKVQVFLNQQSLGGDTEPDGWFVNAWNHPLLLELPSTEGQDNWLYFRLVAGDFGSVMSAPVIGKHQILYEAWKNRTFWQVQTSQLSFVFCLLLSVITLWLWRLRPVDLLYLKLAVACISWSFVTAYLFVESSPLGMSSLLVIVHAFVDISSLMLFSFINEALALKLKRAERTMLTLCGFFIVSSIIVPRDYFFYTVYLAHVINLLFLTFILLKGLVSNKSGFWIPGAFIGVVSLGGYDIYHFLSKDPQAWLHSSNLSQFIVPFILLSLFGQLGQRFIQAIRKTEQLQNELEDRVAEQRHELEIVYSKKLELEIEQGALSQREKIYRDLHDDVGSKLTSILHGADRNQTVVLARHALESIRASIFRAKFPQMPLTQLLEICREETLLRASAVNVEVRWNQIVNANLVLQADTNYHLTRIIREAVSNSLNASIDEAVTIEVNCEVDQFLFTITNGKEPAESISSKFSNGISNIRYRAAEIGASAMWDDGLPETMTFILSLPYGPGRVGLSSAAQADLA